MAFMPAVTNEDGKVCINVHPLSQKPIKAWEVLKVHQVHKKVQRLPLAAPVVPHKVRFVCVSDTHNRTDRMKPVPDGDILLHAGDFTEAGRWQEVEHFNNWLGTLPHKHKIVIAGNHELSFDPSLSDSRLAYSSYRKPGDYPGINDVRELLTNCVYLEDSEVKVCGLRIYGSPWQPRFGNWAYNLPRGKACLDEWDKIPEGVDVLMTHGPPIGHGDLCCTGVRAGCVELLHTIQHRVRPKYHVFGHIHEDPGISSDGNTKYINASTCTKNYRPGNAPIIFDLDLPEGHTKDDISLVGAACHLPYEKTEKIEVDIADEASNFSAPNHSKNERAENFMDYCETANMSDELGNMNFGPNF